MDKNTINTLLMISSGCLTVAAMILLAVSIFGSNEGNYPLTMALGCIVLANLFNVVRHWNAKREK